MFFCHFELDLKGVWIPMGDGSMIDSLSQDSYKSKVLIWVKEIYIQESDQNNFNNSSVHH